MKSMDSKFTKQFESRMVALLPSKARLISEAVHKAVEDTNHWLNALPATVSQLNIRQYFLQKFSQIFPTGDALQDTEILSILLDDVGLRKLGDSIELNGEKWKVKWRRFGLGFGIEFGLSNDSGKTMNHIFYE
jgi:hypothetical protein